MFAREKQLEKQKQSYPCFKTSTFVEANIQRHFQTSYTNGTKGN